MSSHGSRGLPTALLDPRHVAIVGLSDDPAKHGARVLANLRRLGFGGVVTGVNPRRPAVEGVEVVARLAHLAESHDVPPDVVVCAVPGPSVAAVVEEAGAVGARAAVVFAGGFAESGDEGRAAQEELATTARRAGVALLGPNSGGVIRPSHGLALSFLTCLERPAGEMRTGPVGVVTQSGGTGSYLHNLAAGRGGGLAVSVSTGNEAGIGLADAVAAVAALEEVRAVALVLETVRDGEGFLDALRQAAGKPVVACRLGASERGRRLMTTHTGALAVPARVLDGVLDHLGIPLAETPGELLEVAEMLALVDVPAGGRTGVVTHSGGMAILLADLAERHGVELPAPGPELAGRLGPLLDHGAADNPLDMGGIIGGPERYARVVEEFASSGDYDTVLAVSTAHPPAHTERRVESLLEHAPPVPVVHLWMAGDQGAAGLARLRKAGAAVSEEPRAVMRALASLARRAAGGKAPPSLETVEHRPRPEVGEGPLSEHRAKLLLAEWGIPVVEGDLATTAEQAVSIAGRVGFPVAVKASTGDLSHKTEAGAIRLSLHDAGSVAAAFQEVTSAAERAASGSPEGVRVERMRPGLEMIVGAVHDPAFGPVVLVGTGGVAAEAIGDVAVAPAPVSVAGAGRMIDRLRRRAALDVARGGAAADSDGLAGVVSRLSEVFVAGASWLEEVEINPLVWTDEGWEALDALVRLKHR